MKPDGPNSRRCAMELRPVGAIAAVSPVNVKRTADDIAPPFAIDGTIPMEEDSYNASANEQDGELEDDPRELADEENMMSDSDAEEPPRKVNFFA